MEIHTIGIDLAETVFHLVGLNGEGEVVYATSVHAASCCGFTANRQVSLIGIEAVEEVTLWAGRALSGIPF